MSSPIIVYEIEGIYCYGEITIADTERKNVVLDYFTRFDGREDFMEFFVDGVRCHFLNDVEVLLTPWDFP